MITLRGFYSLSFLLVSKVVGEEVPENVIDDGEGDSNPHRDQSPVSGEPSDLEVKSVMIFSLRVSLAILPLAILRLVFRQK